MNKEAIPLLLGIITPILLVSIILLHIHGYNIIHYLKNIDPIYYIIIFPMILGIILALSGWKKT
ncbi:MAG: hypothetical protein DRN08_02740 [Thermoplasmata archaeon]|nr:MAG: hypothetical protein DRN05_03855 [Thermoplasmata archaeon]RLF35625.1 MAG: hypothetical protein DRN08_02740 [Thermoplasmata archaeon]